MTTLLEPGCPAAYAAETKRRNEVSRRPDGNMCISRPSLELEFTAMLWACNGYTT
jgi:hypothetical protein